MTERLQAPIYDNILGIKIGSKNTVVYDGVNNPVKILTCMRQKSISQISNEYVYEFGDAAEGWDDTLWPLKHGVPRNDVNMPISTSIRLAKAFVGDILKDVPDDSGIAFALPMIKARDGLAALKSAITDTTKGRRGIIFFSEARAAAFGSRLSTEDIVGTNVVVINFGSSTVETVFHTGKRRVDENVYTFGGSRIDERLRNAIMQHYSGVTCDSATARVIKEHYDYGLNNDVEVILTLNGSKRKQTIEGDVIKEIVDTEALDRVVARFMNEFIPACNAKNEDAVHSLQVSGRGYLVIGGGMVNMPGFANELHRRLIEIGGISEDVELIVPENGVNAPAIGAWKVAQALEHQRVIKGNKQWLGAENPVGDE